MGSKLEWFVKKDNTYEQLDEIYAGSYTDKKPISVTMQLWNNRWGTSDAEPLTDFYMLMSFKNKEDSVLLDYCNVTMGETTLTKTRSGDKVILGIPTGTKISGTKNNGKESNPKNSDHFINLKFTFDAFGQNLKENDLKELYLEIIKN